MSKLGQHKDSAVSKQASQLVAKWKKEISKNGKKGGPKTDVSSNVNQGSPKKKPESAPQVPNEQEKPKEEEKSAPRQRVREADAEYEEQQKQDAEQEIEEDYEEFVSRNYTDDAIRKNIRKGIAKHLLKVDPNAKKKATILAIKLENGLAKEYGKKPAEYSNKCRTVVASLMRSQEFRKRIMIGNLKPESIATMDPKEMQDEALKRKRVEMEKDIIDAKRSDYMIANMKVKEGMYTCSKCKGKKTTFYEQQTRSADEPMTTFVQCLDCGHNMKF